MAPAKAVSRISNSRFTSMRRAWKVRRAGWTRRRPEAGTAAATTWANWVVVAKGLTGDDGGGYATALTLIGVAAED